MTLLRFVASLFARLARWWLAAPRWLRWSAVVAIMGALWWTSSKTFGGGEPNAFGELAHNAMHLVAFGSLAAAAWFACGTGDRAAAIASVVLAVAYGCVDEFHQSFVPGRTSSAADVLTDGCGAVVAVWALGSWFAARWPRPYEAFVLALACAVSVVLATFVW